MEERYWDLEVQMLHQDKNGKWTRDVIVDNDYLEFSRKADALKYIKQHQKDKDIELFLLRYVDEDGCFDENKWFEYKGAGKADYYI